MKKEEKKEKVNRPITNEEYAIIELLKKIGYGSYSLVREWFLKDFIESAYDSSIWDVFEENNGSDGDTRTNRGI